jgi:hypothetical protein
LGFGVDIDGADARVARSGSLTIPPREGDITVFGQPPGDDANADSWNATIIDIAPHAEMAADLGALALTAGLRFDGYVMETSRQTPRVGQTPSIGLSHLDGELEPRSPCASAPLRVCLCSWRQGSTPSRRRPRI